MRRQETEGLLIDRNLVLYKLFLIDIPQRHQHTANRPRLITDIFNHIRLDLTQPYIAHNQKWTRKITAMTSRIFVLSCVIEADSNLQPGEATPAEVLTGVK